MVLNNVVSRPIQKQKQVKLGSSILSNEVERYLFLNNSGQFLPKSVQVLKGTYNSSSNALQNLLTYHEYDNYGNLMEVAKEGGAHVLYLWGYDRQFPIAKIENTSKTILQNILGTLTDVDETDLSAINNLRNNTSFKESMITTYDYDPSFGIVSLIDPAGLEISFFYDSSGRLKMIKDDEGNIIEEYNYHYKGE